MKIICKYDESSVDIEGSEESLCELSRTIQKCAGSEQLLLLLPQSPPTPDLRYAKSLKIDLGDGNVCISRIADEIIISGSPEKLEILARNIEFLAEQQGRSSSGTCLDHLHIEYHPGHFYLREESIPLVVTRQDRVAYP